MDLSMLRSVKDAYVRPEKQNKIAIKCLKIAISFEIGYIYCAVATSSESVGKRSFASKQPFFKVISAG